MLENMQDEIVALFCRCVLVHRGGYFVVLGRAKGAYGRPPPEQVMPHQQGRNWKKKGTPWVMYYVTRSMVAE